ncbi:MAG: FAD-binding protein [Lachnospiraceae bacterium]|nr:FAD-binding protein [Lachnospiraceae bacterium]
MDAYGGLYETMHWFEGDMAVVGYVPAMEEKASSPGVEFLLETSGLSLIFDGTQVKGIYAQREDGSYIQIDAKGVVLTTGGFGYNDKLLPRWGFCLDHLKKMENPNNNGDGRGCLRRILRCAGQMPVG